MTSTHISLTRITAPATRMSIPASATTSIPTSTHPTDLPTTTSPLPQQRLPPRHQRLSTQTVPCLMRLMTRHLWMTHIVMSPISRKSWASAVAAVAAVQPAPPPTNGGPQWRIGDHPPLTLPSSHRESLAKSNGIVTWILQTSSTSSISSHHIHHHPTTTLIGVISRARRRARSTITRSGHPHVHRIYGGNGKRYLCGSDFQYSEHSVALSDAYRG